MERVFSTDLEAHAGQRVRVAGWVHRLRRLSRVTFLILRDARGLTQVVIENAELAERMAAVHAESVVQVQGVVVASEQAPSGFEIHAPEIEIVAAAAEPPALDLFRPLLNHQLPTLLDHAALALRHTHRRAVWELAAASLAGFRASLTERGFVEIATPKIVGAATEGGASVFALDYFGRPAYLAQSPQFYKQIMVGVFERVFETGPVFRAEPHDTTRHLNEYTSMDAEMGFIQDHTDVMAALTETVRAMLESMRNRCAHELALLGIELPALPAAVPGVHFADALAMIGDAMGQDLHTEPDLAPAHERWLGEWALREHGSDFVFVVGYPMMKRPFYTHPDPWRPRYSNSFDLLFRGLELVTGGQRLHRYEDYVTALRTRGQEPETVSGYLEAFRSGMPPHGGFALGLERWVAQIASIANVREVALFPRDRHRVAP